MATKRDMIIYSRWNCQQSSLMKAHPRGAPDETWTTEQLRRRADSRRMVRYRFWDEWLTQRLDLFEKYTYPSVQSQTDQNFRWIGLAHRDSPTWFIEALRKYNRMELHLVTYDTETTINGGISVNLDTDDALSRDFVKNAQNVAVGETVYTHGVKYRERDSFWFDTVDEVAGSVYNVINHCSTTVLDYMHGRSDLDKHLIHTEDPKWLQVVHGRNVANGFRPHEEPGGRTDLEQVQRYFEIRKEHQ